MGLCVDKIDGQEMVGWTLMGGRDGEKRDEGVSAWGLSKEASLVGEGLRQED